MELAPLVLFPFIAVSISVLTAYGSLGRHVSHRACTRVRHSALSAALCAASAHDLCFYFNAPFFYPVVLCFSYSFSDVFIYLSIVTVPEHRML